MRMAQTDLSEFARIYDKYVALIYAYCWRRLRSNVLAEDATSAVFMKALAATPGFKPGTGSVRSWLFAIAHNVTIDQFRRMSSRADHPLEAAAEIMDNSPSPETIAVRNEAARDLETAMEWLTDEQRRVIELRLAGLAGPEIAAVLGISHGAVRALQKRALMRLRGVMCGSSESEWQ